MAVECHGERWRLLEKLNVANAPGSDQRSIASVAYQQHWTLSC